MIRVLPTPPNTNDTVIGWAKSKAISGFVKPSLCVRMATDANWIFNHKDQMNHYDRKTNVAAMMNCGLPGMRLPGILNWSVTETLDSATQTATLELANALPVSQTSATLTGYISAKSVGTSSHHMPAIYHSPQILRNWVRDPNGAVTSLGGGMLENYTTYVGGYQYTYQEDRLLYREMDFEGITLDSLAGFPDPRIPSDEDDNQTYWPASGDTAAQGSYFVLIGNEVLRVCNYSGTTLYIPPGGRGINGIIEEHNAGDTVSLLGFGPFTGKWAGIGYLSNTESLLHRSLVRPGNCFASYEGFGNFDSTGQGLVKDSWKPSTNRGYEFTGYWFVKGQQSTIGEDGVPKTTVDLVSAGWILQHQKITQNVIFRLRNQLVNWAQGAFDLSGSYRNIPGDSVDYQNWEPENPNSYPLHIKTEFAQHKQFFDHMQETENGKTCEFCQQEWTEYVSRPNYVKGSNQVGEARAVGKHVYKESIRVYDGGNGPFDAGPLRTYGALMIRLAQAAWDVPTYGNSLAQRWTKIPTGLWSNMANLDNGMCWNGNLSFKFQGETVDYPYGAKLNTAEDTEAHFFRDKLLCPFESSYDKQDWFQPLQDLADLNRMTFNFDRQGRPIFIPKGLNLRGISYSSSYDNTQNRGEWFMGWGASVSNYTYNLDTDTVLTQVYVTGITAFADSEFTVVAAGTGLDLNGNLLWYSSKVGNKEALQITGGVQQIDTLSLDSMQFGLDWDTNPAGWSLEVDRTSAGDGITEISKLPAIPSTKLYKGKNGMNKDDIKRLKQLYNFIITRQYMDPAYNNGYIYPANVNEDFDDDAVAITKALQQFFWQKNTNPGINVTHPPNGIWSSDEYLAATEWGLSNAEYIKKDVWWYAISGYDWIYYVAAVTGLPIPELKNSGADVSSQDANWVVDQLALRRSVANWQQQYFKQALSVGNRMVDESIEKATVRTITTDIADPRIHLGDIAYITIPGYLDANDAFGDPGAPDSAYRNATYITQISRQMDLIQQTYSATYAGYRYRSDIDSQIGHVKANFFGNE